MHNFFLIIIIITYVYFIHIIVKIIIISDIYFQTTIYNRNDDFIQMYLINE